MSTNLSDEYAERAAAARIMGDAEAAEHYEANAAYYAGPTAAVGHEAEWLYEKCLHCHLFVEPNSSFKDSTPQFPIAEHEHLHRGDEADTLLDESHEAKPSGMRATLATWKEYGPLAMRQRFDDYDPTKSQHVLVTDDGIGVTITAQPSLQKALDVLRENFAQDDQVADEDLAEFVAGQGVIVYIESI